MQGVSEGESIRTGSESDMDMGMQYYMAVCEEEGEEDTPRRSEEDADGSEEDQQSHAAPMDGTGAAFPVHGKPGGVEEGYDRMKEERDEGQERREHQCGCRQTCRMINQLLRRTMAHSSHHSHRPRNCA